MFGRIGRTPSACLARSAVIAWARCSSSLQINLVQKWLGHAQLTTTAIYANAVGAEEKDIACLKLAAACITQADGL